MADVIAPRHLLFGACAATGSSGGVYYSKAFRGRGGELSGVPHRLCGLAAINHEPTVGVLGSPGVSFSGRGDQHELIQRIHKFEHHAALTKLDITVVMIVVA